MLSVSLQVRSRTCWHVFVDASVLSTFTDASENARIFVKTFSSAHFCCTAFAYNCFLLLSPAHGGMKGESSWLSRQYLERQVAVRARCQYQATAIQLSKCYCLTFALNSGLVCHFWETGRLISSRI